MNTSCKKLALTFQIVNGVSCPFLHMSHIVDERTLALMTTATTRRSFLKRTSTTTMEYIGSLVTSCSHCLFDLALARWKQRSQLLDRGREECFSALQEAATASGCGGAQGALCVRRSKNAPAL